MTTLEQFGARLARRSEDPATRDLARLRIADTVGAWLAASATAEGRALFAYRPTIRAGAAAGSDDLLDRVSRHCALARLSELDDIHLASCTTPGALVVPAALTLGASLAVERATLVAAIAAGYDAITTLGRMLGGPAILYRGIWPTYLCAPFGVAAVTARLLGLGDTPTAHALGIALALSSPGVGHQSGPAMSRWLAMGQAARNGVSAALAAQAGFSADLRLFEGEFFRSVYGITPEFAGLDQTADAASALAAVSVKPWCAARQTMAATQALREIIATGIEPAAMERIAVSVPAPTLKMIAHGVVAGDRASHLTSAPYQMALAAFSLGSMLDANQAPPSISDELRAFMAKITVAADDALLAHYPASWPARIAVTTRAGSTERFVLSVPGDPQRPLDETALAAKFQRAVAPVLGEAPAQALRHASFGVFDRPDGPRALLERIQLACDRAGASSTGELPHGASDLP